MRWMVVICMNRFILATRYGGSTTTRGIMRRREDRETGQKETEKERQDVEGFHEYRQKRNGMCPLSGRTDVDQGCIAESGCWNAAYAPMTGRTTGAWAHGAEYDANQTKSFQDHVTASPLWRVYLDQVVTP